MIKRDIGQLAIYQLEKRTEMLSLACLRDLYLQQTSEIIYIVLNKKLYGIICLEDVLHHSENGNVRINQNFTVLTGYDVIRAHEIFQQRRKIHKIPVINNEGELLGDYSRWDDLLFLEHNMEIEREHYVLKKILSPYEAIYIVAPIANKRHIYLYFMEHLERLHIPYEFLEKEEVIGKLTEKAICICADEDEKRGVQCLCGMQQREFDSRGYDIRRYDMPVDTCCKIRLTTYKNLFLQIIDEVQLYHLGIKKTTDQLYDRRNFKVTRFLSELEKKGVKCFCLYSEGIDVTEYWRKFIWDIIISLRENPINPIAPWSKGKENEIFYTGLYDQEDYQKEIAQREIFYSTRSFEYKKNIRGKYFNARDGKRITCFQPEKYIGTIYLLGLCTFVGLHVEDQHTISSYLQRMLLEKGYAYRVENYGIAARADGEIETRLEEIGKFQINDIVICQSSTGEAVDIDGISLEKIYEKNNVPIQWIMDTYGHCNHKVNQFLAEGIFERIEPFLSEEMVKRSGNVEVKINANKIMGDYVRSQYLDKYFSHFSGEKYNTVGAIIMKGDPFHQGHRYLIEQAIRRVEFLILFVIDADEFIFPFEERFEMIVEGTRDINNIMVVPSGDFIFSKSNFKEYYTQQYDVTAALNAEYDINVFADFIAAPLHITHRFVGEAAKKRVMKVYNEKMKTILPQKGITYTEMKRISVDGEVVSSAVIQDYLRNREYSKAFRLLPESSKKYLESQIKDLSSVEVLLCEPEEGL